MADWYGSARSNVFTVKNLSEFHAALKNINIQIDAGKEENTVVLFSMEDSAGWPSSCWDDEAYDVIEFDLVDIIAPHLADGAIAILMEVGAEKLRYLTGYTIAFDNTGKTVVVDLNDIYGKAKEVFNVEPTRAEY